MKIAFLLLPLLAQADGLGLTLRQYHDVLPKEGAMECRLEGNEGFGYVVHRDGENGVRTYVINKNVSEGEKTAVDGSYMNPSDLSYLYVKHHTRHGEYGNYLEIVVNKKPDPQRFDFKGVVMFTEAHYSKNEDGSEREELMPIAKTALRCKTLR